ncbi:hypothetical protein E2C01_016818 [Portunus trituberculatus]|uniref:Uncharacterized protein n=1 Tax=Portunus trituberculatus TaxID=210409 RepID=A0A5B7DRJ6_PORTR|nr:hypothetical protein [Portunus trituberculatus]
MSAPDSGIHMGFDVVELDEGDLEAILREGGDGNGFYTLKSKPPVACRWVWVSRDCQTLAIRCWGGVSASFRGCQHL